MTPEERGKEAAKLWREVWGPSIDAFRAETGLTLIESLLVMVLGHVGAMRELNERGFEVMQQVVRRSQGGDEWKEGE